MLLAVPGIVRLIGPLLGRAQARWADETHPRYVAVAREWAAQPLHRIGALDLLEAPRPSLGPRPSTT
jgi:hypothetical protein